MSIPDKSQQPDDNVQDLSDEQLDQVSGGVRPVTALGAAGVDGDLEGVTPVAAHLEGARLL